MKKILITGASGFVSGYLVKDLLDVGYEVIGVDNFSKYGKVEKSYDSHPNYKFIEGDAKDTNLLNYFLDDCEHFIASAAMIGGISYFHSFPYDLLAENERIMASSFDAAINNFKNSTLKKVTVLSSSMVYESTNTFPTKEGMQYSCPPPLSSYGFQKLAVEYFARSAFSQYGLPYTILRPFNAVGIGEARAKTDKEVISGNIKLAMSHVVPDLCQKIIKGQNPLHILGNGNQIRHYTAAEDLSRGIIISLENKNALNNDFNLSTNIGHTVLELAEIIWNKIRGDKFNYVCDEPFKYDVQKRIPDVTKAKELLRFETKIKLEDALDKIIPWIEEMIILGKI